jgi:hypothetical protein
MLNWLRMSISSPSFIRTDPNVILSRPRDAQAKRFSFTSGKSCLLKILVAGSLLVTITGKGGEKEIDVPPSEDSESTELREWLPEKVKSRSRWSFEFGVGIITDATVSDYADFNLNDYDNAGEGLTYNLTTSYRLSEADWSLGKVRLQPQLEVPFMLTIVDERGGNVFPDLNLGLRARWRDFPWNRYIYTTLAVGGGFSYSFDVWAADESRHEGEDRSQWKFWLPIEFTMALPKYPQHQITLFIDHQSGGWIFDTGGVDAWGIGYRYLF